jgi:SRSO17 transposase
MPYELNAEGERRLTGFVDIIGDVLGNKKRKVSFATYAMGLLGEGERKSVEPIAARAVGHPELVNAAHQRLLNFIANATWSDREVRQAAVNYAIPKITARAPVDSWILDDTGFLKQGTHSVGVQRQYTGSAGKITNCQLAVSLSLATRYDHLPVDFELYLPRVWTDDRERRAEARIPKKVRFASKIELGIRMIQKAVKANLPRGTVLADSFYGDAARFRAEVRALGLHYAVGVSSNITVWRAGKFSGRRYGDRIAVSALAETIPPSMFHRVNWADGTKTKLSARFALRRVVPCRADGTPPSEREAVWLVIEWEDGKTKPTKYYFVSLPRETQRKAIIRTIMQRWRTERVYEDLKGELGFDHYEGRSFPGWQHHVSVALCCFAFVAGERALAFPPSGGATSNVPELDAPRATLPRLVHHHPPRGGASHRTAMAAEVPTMSPSRSSTANSARTTSIELSQGESPHAQRDSSPGHPPESAKRIAISDFHSNSRSFIASSAG